MATSRQEVSQSAVISLSENSTLKVLSTDVDAIKAADEPTLKASNNLQSTPEMGISEAAQTAAGSTVADSAGITTTLQTETPSISKCLCLLFLYVNGLQ